MMKTGKIKNYFPAERYGFIITEDDEEFFFHINDLHPKFRGKRLMEEMTVAFDVKSDMKGDRAVNIRIN